jgi:hypothetical protein
MGLGIVYMEINDVRVDLNLVTMFRMQMHWIPSSKTVNSVKIYLLHLLSNI